MASLWETTKYLKKCFQVFDSFVLYFFRLGSLASLWETTFLASLWEMHICSLSSMASLWETTFLASLWETNGKRHRSGRLRFWHRSGRRLPRQCFGRRIEYIPKQCQKGKLREPKIKLTWYIFSPFGGVVKSGVYSIC